jgi:hypothetical protein
MKYLFTFVLSIFLYAQIVAQHDYEPKALLMQFQDKSFTPLGQREATLPELSFKLISAHFNLYKCTWESDLTENEMMERLDKIFEDEASILLNYKVNFRNRNVPDDPEYDQQWYMDKIKAPEAWTQTTGGVSAAGDEVVIAVLEEFGPQRMHEDLIESYWFNSGEIPGDGIDNDGNGYTDDYWGLNLTTKNDQHQPDIASSRHATPVCGLLGAQGNNGKQVTGINWSTKLLIISGLQFVDHTIEAYEYVMDLRSKYDLSGGTEGAFIVVTNASFGLDGAKPGDHPILQLWCDMFDRMGEFGILTAAAAPNQDWNVDEIGDMPTNCNSPYLIGVTSTNQDDTQTRFTGYGTGSIDIAAPGADLWTSAPGNSTMNFDGTSAATPLVSGAIALLHTIPSIEFANAYKEKPKAIALLIKESLLLGSDKFSSLNNRVSSSGRLNIYNSMISIADLGYGELSQTFGVNKLYPNPGRDYINLLADFRNTADSEICLYSITGRQIFCRDYIPEIFNENLIELDISTILPGIYVLSIKQGRSISSKIFVKM